MPTKRQRNSADLTPRGHFGPNQTYNERDHDDQRHLYNPYSTRGQQPSPYEANYPPGANAPPSSEFTYRHQRTDSSSTTSPHASPQNEVPGYGSSSAATSTYPSQTRGPFFHYPAGTLPIVPSRPAQLAQPPPTVRSQPLVDQPPTAVPARYTRTSQPEESVLSYSRQTPRFYPTNAQHQPDSRPVLAVPLLDSLSSGSQYAARTNFPNVLPPLESTVTPGQNRNVTLQGYSHNGAPSPAAGGSMIPMAAQSLPEVEADHHGQQALNYSSSLYRRREGA